jgi:hypothetical protein
MIAVLLLILFPSQSRSRTTGFQGSCLEDSNLGVHVTASTSCQVLVAHVPHVEASVKYL